MRKADIGLDLGYRTAETISIRQEMDRLRAITDTNKVAKTRLDASDLALKNMGDMAQKFLSNLVLARTGGLKPDALANIAKNTLHGFTDAANTTMNGSYLFSGINSDVKPLASYDASPPSAAKTALDTAFQAAFGMNQSDPNLKNVTGAQMKAFLDGPFKDMFEKSGSGWSNWSSASDKNVENRISSSETAETGTNANEDAFRKLAEAFTMMSELGSKHLSEDAFNVLVDKATELVNAGVTELTRLRTNIGSAQSRMQDANARMDVQLKALDENLGALENIDPAEVATRVTSLMTQLQTAYQVTGRLQSLSLLNYLR